MSKSIIKRDGTKQTMKKENIETRLINLKEGYTVFGLLPSLSIDINEIVLKTIKGVKDGMPTSRIDLIAVDEANKFYKDDLEYGQFASRIYISNLVKNIYHWLSKEFNIKFSHVRNKSVQLMAQALWNNTDVRGKKFPLLSGVVYSAIMKYAKRFQKMINQLRNFNRKYRSIHKLVSGQYLQKVHHNGVRTTIETPEFMYLRVALGVLIGPATPNKETAYNKVRLREIFNDMNGKEEKWPQFYEAMKYNTRFFGAKTVAAQECEVELTEAQFEEIESLYNMLSKGKCTFATPCMLNAGTNNSQLSSCYLIPIIDDSLPAIEKNWADCAETSKYGGGIAVHGNVCRSKGSYIAGTNGVSNGTAGIQKTQNEIMNYVDQGGGKRKGVEAKYDSPWNANVPDQLYLCKAISHEAATAHNIFYALWTSDHFFRCYRANADWYLFDPAVASELRELHDIGPIVSKMLDKWDPKLYPFTAKFYELVAQGKYISKINTREYFRIHIFPRLQDSGRPYMLSKDNVNNMNPQTAPIYGSNLCTEITLHTSEKEFAVCTLASIALNRYIITKPKEGAISFKRTYLSGRTKMFYYDTIELKRIVRMITRCLDRVIDINLYPVPEMENSNKKRRPMGIGIQGLADALIMLGLPFGSPAALEFTRMTQEIIYWTAMMESTELARIKGPYATFAESPAKKGILHPDMYEKRTGIKVKYTQDWDLLRNRIAQLGLRNSVVCANMPTGSTSHILGNSQSFEPYDAHIHYWAVEVKRYIVINEHLVNELAELGLWKRKMRNHLIINNGSIRAIDLEGLFKLTAAQCKHLRELYPSVKDVNMKEVIDMAAARQPFCDQSQSMNLYLPILGPKKVISLWAYGWRRGLKTLSYYFRSEPPTRPQTIGNEDDCEMCSS